MTKKQIIIDGVDVSGCEKLGETIDGITCGLGKRIRFANKIITKHNLCKNNPNCYYKQLKAKEQECEELKEALTEIRKIAEKEVKHAPDGETFARPEIKQILQKISEVENEN